MADVLAGYRPLIRINCVGLVCNFLCFSVWQTRCIILADHLRVFFESHPKIFLTTSDASITVRLFGTGEGLGVSDDRCKSLPTIPIIKHFFVQMPGVCLGIALRHSCKHRAGQPGPEQRKSNSAGCSCEANRDFVCDDEVFCRPLQTSRSTWS